MKKTHLIILFLLLNYSVFPQTGGPWTHSVYKAYSPDGSNFERDSSILFFPASVPDAVKDTNETVFLYYVKMISPSDTEKLMVASSPDGEYFYAPQLTNISGSSVIRRVDPCAVLLPDGRIRLFYIDFDMQPPQDVHSAISSDGFNFTEEPGIRYSDPTGITDPDVFDVSGTWNMYVSKGNQLIRTTATDGLTFEKDTNFVWNNGAVSSTIQLSCGLYKTYYCGNGIQPANSPDGSSLVPENVSCFPSMQNEIVCDPSVIRLITGAFLMYFKSAMLTSIDDADVCSCGHVLQNYPNPFSDHTVIDLPIYTPGNDLKLTLYDVTGKIIYQKEFPDGTKQIILDENAIVPGLYFFMVRNNNFMIGKGKLNKAE